MSSRRRDDRGTALMLLPAAVLIVIGLAGLAVDGTARYLTHADLVDAADAAANDAVAGALVTDQFTNGIVTLDPARATRIVAASLAARADPILEGATTTVRVIPGDPAAVEVDITTHVRGIFFPMLDEEITVTGRAVLAVGDA